MKKNSIAIIALALSTVLGVGARENRRDYVRPLAGTDGYGNVYPGAQVPFGGIQISPDTDNDFYDAASGYKYSHKTIMGFSLNHLSGTGIPDLGDFLFMPGTGEIRLEPGTHENPDSGYRSRYSHEKEWCSPDYYAVELSDYQVKAEMTSAQRSGMFRFTYPKADEAFILIDMQHTLWWQCVWSDLRVEDEHTVTGYKLVKGWGPERHVYLRAEFSEPIRDFGIMQNGRKVQYDTDRFRSAMEAWGTGLKFWMKFATEQNHEVTVKVAISSVDPAGAEGNMKEIDGLTFDQIKERGEKEWEKQLSIFDVTGTDEEKETFYTSAYRCFLSPFLFHDADGRFRELDKSIGHTHDFTNYTTFSLWDTYRAYHPLLNLIRQDMSSDIANSMLAHYDKSVERMLPIWSFYGNETWCMIGYHAVSVLADMIVKQVPGFDYERAFEAMKTTATNKNYDCISEYTSLGYVPFDKESESVSKTLEYAYDDYCIAQAAKALGKEDDYKFFIERSLSYRNLIDPHTGFMRGKDSEGNWRTPFAPVTYQGPGSVHGWGDITEGFTLQYSWYVPHNVQDHINRVGKKLYKARLDSLFTTELPDDIPGAHDIWGRIGAYWHGNEPCHNVIYLYNYLGQPWECQKRIRQVAKEFYGNKPGSLSGNDDCGQMSAWYIFNAMGFYPTAPSSNVYNIGSPAVKGLEVKLYNGKSIRMTTANWSEDNVYIKKLFVNGKEWDKSYITYADIRNGAELHFIMSPVPDRRRAVSPAAIPPSLPDATGHSMRAENMLQDGDPSSAFIFRQNDNSVILKSPGKPVLTYRIYSSGMKPETDPSGWTLYGSKNGKTWQELDSRSGQIFFSRFQEITCEVNNPGNYSMYRLEFIPQTGRQSCTVGEISLGTTDNETAWKDFVYPEIAFRNHATETKGSRLYHELVQNPDKYISYHARKVAEQLFYSAADTMNTVGRIGYTLSDYDGISAKSGNPEHTSIVYSTRHIENSASESMYRLDYETRGVLFHELVHAYQFEPKGIGTYSTNKEFWACIEGLADAVRANAGYFDINASRRPGGHWLDGYRTTGFFLQWLTTKDPDAIKKFHISVRDLNPWSFDGAMKEIFGPEYGIEALWNEYQEFLTSKQTSEVFHLTF